MDKSTRGARWLAPYVCVFGIFLGLCLWKFGNPVILDKQVTPPKTFAEALEVSWPVGWGNWILGVLGVFGLLMVRPSLAIARTKAPLWLVMMPLVWLAWQLVSASRTVDPVLTQVTLPQLIGTVVCFFIGWFVLTRDGWPKLLLPGLLASFAFSMVRGANQHHFEFRRDYEILREGQATGWTNFSPEVLTSLKQGQLVVSTNGVDIANPMILEKLRRGRVHGTLVYPNAFAGAILLLLPMSLAVVFTGTGTLRPWLRWSVIGLTLGLGIGCLYWTGSKSGWLIGLAVASIGTLLRAPWSSRWKWAFTLGVATGGLILFTWRFESYFSAGATSVSARLDYWRAAVQVVRENPLYGTGPGTFQRPYARLKTPEAEMARLAHNDYLQQYSDSGWPGGMAYLAWIIGSLSIAGRKIKDPVTFGLFLGVLGWFAQGLSEFGLYIPALAWCAFTLLGILLGLPTAANLSGAGDAFSQLNSRVQKTGYESSFS